MSISIRHARENSVLGRAERRLAAIGEIAIAQPKRFENLAYERIGAAIRSPDWRMAPRIWARRVAKLSL
jgi:hypothetical protein